MQSDFHHGLLCPSVPAAAQSIDLTTRTAAAERARRDGRLDEAMAIYRDLASARPADVAIRRMLAEAYAALGRRIDAVTELRKVTELAPRLPSGWYALGQAYNDIKQEAIGTFDDRPEESLWQRLLVADALLANGTLTDAFVLYRALLEQLPSMVSMHDSVARIYERTGHAAWAARERAAGPLSAADCARRRVLCEFRAGRYRGALAAALAQSDAESRYWRARASNELALAAFKRLDALPDSAERRAVRATVARTEERYIDAIAELKAALRFAPGDPALVHDLAWASYLARDFEQAIGTLSPLLRAHPDEPRLLKMTGYSLLQLRRLDEAIAVLQRASERDPTDPEPRLALGRARLQNGDFAAAIPLIEPQIADDEDGHLHVQLARAYTALGQRDKAAALLVRSQELERAAQERSAAAAGRRITAPKD